MPTMTIGDLAGSLARSTGSSFVLIEAENSGSDHRLAQAFPSLDEDQLEMLRDETIALRFDETGDAQEAFNLLTDDLERATEDHGGLVEGTIRYYGTINGSPVITTSNAIGGGRVHRDDLHVFEGGTIVNRARR